MRKSKLSLPIDAKGLPNWGFMEQYMIKLESEHILDYLQIKQEQILR